MPSEWFRLTMVNFQTNALRASNRRRSTIDGRFRCPGCNKRSSAAATTISFVASSSSSIPHSLAASLCVAHQAGLVARRAGHEGSSTHW